MNYPRAIVIAAALIAGAFVFSIKAQASPAPEGRFQILIAPSVGVWRIDTMTGQLRYCQAARRTENLKEREIKCW